MKSLIVIVGLISALCLRAGVAAMQSNDVISETAEALPYLYDLDDDLMPQEAIAELSLDLHKQTYLQKTRGYIAHITGALDAEIMDSKKFRSEVVCYSQSSEGSVFRTFGNNAGRTQNSALKKCFPYRGVCEVLGCIPL